MAKQKNEYHIVWFDPGGRTGWAHLVLHAQAFTNPQAKVLRNILHWSTGEFSGQETAQLKECVQLIHQARYGEMPFRSQCDVGSEDFELTQLIGGRDLLIPVRMNAVLAWECQRVYALNLILQARQLRTGVTKERLKLWKLWPVAGKDSFAAMQHAVTWLRRVKAKANERPWKLE